MWRDRTIRDAVWRGVDALRALASREAPRATRPARDQLDVVSPDGSKRFVRRIFSSGSAYSDHGRRAPGDDDRRARRARARAPVERALAPALRNHPWRLDVQAVLHQRPWKRVPVPSLISSVTTTHLAPHVVDGVECPLDNRSRGDAVAYEAEYAHLRRLCEHFIVSPPPHGGTFFTTVVGPWRTPWGKTHRGHHVHLHAMPRDRSRRAPSSIETR